MAGHQHQPVYVRSRPVIERLPVNVIEPTDLCISASGRMFIADRQAQVVFQLQPDGTTALAATELEGLLRITVDRDGTLYVLTASEGSGRVLHVSAAGHTTELFSVDFAPCGFARDVTGSFVVSSSGGRTVVFHADGTSADLAMVSETVVDVALNSADQIHVLLKSGRVVQLGHDGTSVTSAFAPAQASRLLALPEGQLAVLHQEQDLRPAIRVCADSAADLAATATFAQVPAGTVAAAFDQLGNLCLANPQLRAVTKVTSRFEIPCPHCGRPVKMIFTTSPPENEAPAQQRAAVGIKRSF